MNRGAGPGGPGSPRAAVPPYAAGGPASPRAGAPKYGPGSPRPLPPGGYGAAGYAPASPASPRGAAPGYGAQPAYGGQAAAPRYGSPPLAAAPGSPRGAGYVPQPAYNNNGPASPRGGRPQPPPPAPAPVAANPYQPREAVASDGDTAERLYAVAGALAGLQGAPAARPGPTNPASPLADNAGGNRMGADPNSFLYGNPEG